MELFIINITKLKSFFIVNYSFVFVVISAFIKFNIMSLNFHLFNHYIYVVIVIKYNIFFNEIILIIRESKNKKRINEKRNLIISLK